MKVHELLEVLQGGIPTVRIIDDSVKRSQLRNGAGVMACDYLDQISLSKDAFKRFYDCEVTHFNVTLEVSHKRYKELGLIPPFRPDLTAEYEIGALNQKIYYDIFINAEEVKEHCDNEKKET